MPADCFDAAVVGAGPAGAAAALALARAGARVVLVERRATPEDRLGESLRGLASEALRELGVWEHFQRLEQRPTYLHRASWGGELGMRDAIRSLHGPDLHLDRVRFDTLLIDAAVERGATLLRPAKLGAVVSAAGSFKLDLAHAGKTRTLTARVLVDATGRAASVARRFGATRRQADRLVGVARRFERGEREPSTLVESADDGWWYSAPVPGNRMVALFLTDADSPAHAARDPAVWQRCLESAPLTQRRLAGAEDVNEVRSYAAAPSLLEWDARTPILPVGDAALTFDPIAADGLCFALRSGLDAAIALKGPPGSTRRYWAGTRALYHHHLQSRELVYARERRVRPTSFWLRLRDGTSTPAFIGSRAPAPVGTVVSSP